MSAMDFLALVIVMLIIGILVDVILGLHKMERKTMAALQEYDNPFNNQDKGNAA